MKVVSLLFTCAALLLSTNAMPPRMPFMPIRPGNPLEPSQYLTIPQNSRVFCEFPGHARPVFSGNVTNGRAPGWMRNQLQNNNTEQVYIFLPHETGFSNFVVASLERLPFEVPVQDNCCIIKGGEVILLAILRYDAPRVSISGGPSLFVKFLGHEILAGALRPWYPERSRPWVTHAN